MTAKPAVASVADLLAHAYAMESEAHERYRDLADQMEVHNNHEVAELFRKMAAIELLHAEKIRERAGDALKKYAPWTYRWPGFESPEAADVGDAHYLMTPHHALSLARGAERAALAFYENILSAGGDANMLALAGELAEEEREHVALIEAWLAKYPEPAPGWDEDPDPPVHQE